MKKIAFIGMLIIMLFITGCGNTIKTQKLVCNQKIKTIEVNMIADFKNNEITYFGLEYIMDLSGISDSQIDLVNKKDMCQVVKTSISQYTDAFNNCKQAKENKTIKVTADFDLGKIIDTNSKEEATIEAFKEKLEKENYSCVVEDK